MGSLNRVQLIGNLGKDPELRYSPEGTPVCNFSIATTESWTSKAGDKQEQTEWHRISMWGKLGEIAGEYLKKGRQVYVEGSIRSRKYKDKEGVDRIAYEIRGDKLVMLNSGEQRAQGEGGGYQKAAPRQAPAQPAQSAAPAARPQVNTANNTVGDEEVDMSEAPF